jgi:hypothetical protein
MHHNPAKVAKLESFSDKSLKIKSPAIAQQPMPWTFKELGHVLSTPVFYNSLLLNDFYFNDKTNFLKEPKGRGAASVGLFYYQDSKVGIV